MVKAELWNPDEWADLFDRAGARYSVLTTKPHSGYTLWPGRKAEQTCGENYNPLKVGPGRNLVGDLASAVCRRGIKVGLYYSLYEWHHPLGKTDKERLVSEHPFPQFKDLATRYRPDIL